MVSRVTCLCNMSKKKSEKPKLKLRKISKLEIKNKFQKSKVFDTCSRKWSTEQFCHAAVVFNPLSIKQFLLFIVALLLVKEIICQNIKKKFCFRKRIVNVYFIIENYQPIVKWIQIFEKTWRKIRVDEVFLSVDGYKRNIIQIPISQNSEDGTSRKYGCQTVDNCDDQCIFKSIIFFVNITCIRDYSTKTKTKGIENLCSCIFPNVRIFQTTPLNKMSRNL